MAFMRWLEAMKAVEHEKLHQRTRQTEKQSQPRIGFHEKLLLLYYWCIQYPEASIETIANSLELSPQEVAEILPHLRDVYSLDDLMARINQYAKQLQEKHFGPYQKWNAQLLGTPQVQQAKDTAEERKLKQRRHQPHI